MPKKVSQEETIVDFFNTADLGKVETLFNVVKGIIKSRTKDSKPAPKLRQPRAPKSVVVAAVPAAHHANHEAAN